MRRLYSIALRNHENHVPIIANQRTPNLDKTVSDGTALADRISMHLTPELVPGGNVAETQLKALERLNNTNAELFLGNLERIKNSQTPQTPAEMQRSKRKRSNSLATTTLHVKTLQFPFDNLVHGGFSKTKQRELNLCPSKHPHLFEHQQPD